ncbi:MAG TPA: hypothetical protein VGR51_01960 [Thermoplasmata archaeon]|nr:hypothetical protein [Thermoplasmata archaeon]
MELTVTRKRENALLDRTEVFFQIAHPQASTPTRGDIKKALAGSLNAKSEVLILDWARSQFGATTTRGYAKLYKSKERAMALETPPILIRNGLLVAVKKEAPVEAPKAPPPKREPKAEAPKEEKKEAPKPERPAKEEKAAKEEKPGKEEKPAKEEEAPKKDEAPKEKKAAGKKEGK